MDRPDSQFSGITRPRANSTGKVISSSVRPDWSMQLGSEAGGWLLTTCPSRSAAHTLSNARTWSRASAVAPCGP